MVENLKNSEEPTWSTRVVWYIYVMA